MPIPYVPTLKGRITCLTSLLDPKHPKYKKCYENNIKVGIEGYEKWFDAMTAIYCVNGKKVDSLQEALQGAILNKESLWLEVCFE